MGSGDDLQHTISAALPPGLQDQAEPLAAILARVADGTLGPAEAQRQLAAVENIAPLLRALDGVQRVAGGTQLSFGEHNQIGSIAIGDVAGGDVTKLTITIVEPQPDPLTVLGRALGWLLRRYRAPLLAFVLGQGLLGLLYLSLADRFLIPRLNYLGLALLLTAIVALWPLATRPRSPSWLARLLRAAAALLTLLGAALLGAQAWAVWSPPPLPAESFGVAIGTFGEGPAQRVTPRGRQITDLVIDALEGVAATDSELQTRLAVRRVGVIPDDAAARAEGRRIDAELVIWGSLLVGDEGSVIYFQLLEPDGLSDNPAFPQALPTVRRSVELRVNIQSTDSFVIEEQAKSLTLIVAALSRGLFFYNQASYQQAADEFDQALQHISSAGPELSDTGLLYFYLGRSYTFLGRFETAMGYFEQAQARFADDPAILLGKHYVAGRLGMAEVERQTMQELEAICNRHAAEPIFGYNCAILNEVRADREPAARTFHLEAALRQYRAAIQDEGDPTRYIAYLGAGSVLARLQRYDEARELYQQAEALVAENPNRLVWLRLYGGRLSEQQGQFDAALAAYSEAAQLAPALATPYYYRASLYAKLQRTDAALLDYRKLVAISYDKAWAHGLLADFLFNSNNYAAAIEQYLEALRHPAFDKSLYYTNLGRAYAQVDARLVPDREERARRAFADALARPTPTEPYIRIQYGIALYGFGRNGEARDAFARALELEPTSVEAALNLGQMHEILGDTEAARTVYAQFLSQGEGVASEQLEQVAQRLAALGE